MQYPRVNYSGIFANMGSAFQRGMTQFDKATEYNKEKLKEEEAVAKLKEMEKDFEGMKKTVADEIAGTMMGQPDKTIDGVKKHIMSIKTPQELYAKANEYRLQLQDFEQNKDVYKIKPLFGIKSTTYANQNRQFVDAAKAQGRKTEEAAEEARVAEEKAAEERLFTQRPGQAEFATKGGLKYTFTEGGDLVGREIFEKPETEAEAAHIFQSEFGGDPGKSNIFKRYAAEMPKKLSPEDIAEQEHKEWKRGEEKRKARTAQFKERTKGHEKKPRSPNEYTKIISMLDDVESDLDDVTVHKNKPETLKRLRSKKFIYQKALEIMEDDEFISSEKAIKQAKGEKAKDVETLFEENPDIAAKIPKESAQSVYNRLGRINLLDENVKQAISEGATLEELMDFFERMKKSGGKLASTRK